MYNKDSRIQMIAASERRKPWLSTLLAILLAAPGLPISAAPGRDAASLGIRAPGKVRVGARDATRVGVSARGRDNQPLKGLLVTLILVSKPGGPGLVNDLGEETMTRYTGDDGVARFSGLRSNGIEGFFEIFAKADGPDGRVIDQRKTIRNFRKFTLFGLSVKQLIGIAAAGAVATGIIAANSGNNTPTITTAGPPIVGRPLPSRRPR